MTTLLKLLIAAALLASTGIRAESAGADGASELTGFFAELRTLSADFEQRVLDDNNVEIQSSSGQMWIMRPGLFRWDYRKPYEQQLVADGERLWSYDKDLEQVTVQAAEEVLTATPAMLLSGNRPLEDVFHIQQQPGRQFVLTPKNRDSNVTGLQLQFSDAGLEQIAAADTFGNTTVFSFSNIRRNPELDRELFRFVPPDGADVVGELP